MKAFRLGRKIEENKKRKEGKINHKQQLNDIDIRKGAK